MFKFIPLILVALLLNGCGIPAIGTAEITGVSLFHDRRSLKTIAIDERIETSASIDLNSDADIRKYTHFNVTSFNGVLLVTGEAPHQVLRNRISAILQRVSDVRLVHNQMVLARPAPFTNRTYDTFITSKVKAKFSTSSDMPGFDTTRIKVVTESGRVFLMGLVYKKEAHIAAENARRVNGVRQVVKVFQYM
ncbi:MAG: BON domain-containing protein [Methylococcaceae bacterium]|nr:BON domain-containing protein [Methylococcaceae bacterium]